MTKAVKSSPAAKVFRYEPADMKPRDHAADNAFIDAFIARNRDALIESIEETDRQFERGEVHTLDEAMAELKAGLLGRNRLLTAAG
jgi:hypothetical protein